MTKNRYNLLKNKWIPVVRKTGIQEKIAPYQITETCDPIISISAPRPDFNGALMEFLIGLLQTTSAPESHDHWVDWLESPPSPETLQQSFSKYAHAFELMENTPLFMQDFDNIEGESKPISALLIDAPGAKALRDNTDHFVKRSNVETMCESCTATALFTLQNYAPSGGVGHRTSLRGGGPLTSLVSLDPYGSDLEQNLWRNLWLNVLDKPNFEAQYSSKTQIDSKSIFPWLAPTRTSENKTGKETHLQQVNPLQMYWGMPRRIRLIWHTGTVQCDMCGCATEVSSHEYITKNYGVNYAGSWQHPLSPHYIDTKTGEPLPVHAQQDGFSYRHWLGWAQGTDTIRPARVVELFRKGTTGRKLEKERLRLSVFGYDMDNMKARGWHQTSYPLYQIEKENLRNDFADYTEKMIEAAEKIANFTQTCIKEAWFKRPSDAKGDTNFIKEAFYHHTETVFYNELDSLFKSLRNPTQNNTLLTWHKQLAKASTGLFDYWATRSDITVSDPRRIAAAHQKLRNMIYGKKFLANLGINYKKQAA